MKQFKEFVPKLDRRVALCLVVGVVIGILLFGLVRFVGQPNDSMHYHANFGVYINGKRQVFEGTQYYQEIASCSAKENPQGRVHMHDSIGHIVHVHADLVTWANFFSVLGWSLNEKVLFDGKMVYQDGKGGELQFILNGQPVRSIANEVIGDEDRLLISYGAADKATLQEQYDELETDAAEYNKRKDPSACKGPEELDTMQRLQRAFWF